MIYEILPHNVYSLGEQTNQNFEMIALIGQYAASFQILWSLVFQGNASS